MEGKRIVNFESTSTVLALLLVAINLSLFIGGFITANEVPTVSSILSNVELEHTNTAAFQESFLMEDDSGNSLGDLTGDSSAVQVLDFLETIPILGPLITLIRIIYELIFTLAFGVVIVLGRISAPVSFQLLLGGICLVIYVKGISDYLLRVLASRGGSQ